MKNSKIILYVAILGLITSLFTVQQCKSNQNKKLIAAVALLQQENQNKNKQFQELQAQYADLEQMGPIEVEVPKIEYRDKKVVEVIDNNDIIVALERKVEKMRDNLDTCGVFWREAYYLAKNTLKEEVKDTILKETISKSYAGYDFTFDVYSQGLKGLSFETKPKLIPSAFHCPECPPETGNRSIGVYYGALYQEELSHLFEIDYSKGPISIGAGYTRPMDGSGKQGWIGKVGLRKSF